MSNLLKGNYKTDREVVAEPEGDDLESRFEREALSRLGGSIAYVSKKKFVWSGDSDKTPSGDD